MLLASELTASSESIQLSSDELANQLKQSMTEKLESARARVPAEIQELLDHSIVEIKDKLDTFNRQIERADKMEVIEAQQMKIKADWLKDRNGYCYYFGGDKTAINNPQNCVDQKSRLAEYLLGDGDDLDSQETKSMKWNITKTSHQLIRMYVCVADTDVTEASLIDEHKSSKNCLNDKQDCVYNKEETDKGTTYLMVYEKLKEGTVGNK